MTRPRLSYFDMPVSRGEECRLAFAIAGADFEDHRIARESWPAMKPTTPFGALPVLEVPGLPAIAQSNAILTYIGRRYGAHPTDLVEAARHEAVMAHVEDLRATVAYTARNADEATKQRAREHIAASTIPAWAGYVEAQISDGPFFAGERPLVVDVKLYMGMRTFRRGVMDHIPTTVFDAFPKLIRLYDAVEAWPAVQAWITR
ncbi:MAG: glutathione S-transferase family protein [Deltaproteobacteria bacterium]|nr:glutathione S-transferase family protein [Myxococcales bacterium]MDP3216319.1 glutathione S-transferase family protein [Deltaproteobacteria bacterium]